MDQQAKAAKKAEQERLRQEKQLRLDKRMEKIERALPFMNMGNALKATCVGFAGGVVLRVVQMLYCFDYATGFYTDGGTMAWCSLLFVMLTGLLGGAMCFCSRRYFGPYVPRKNNMLGVVAALSGVALIASALLQAVDYIGYLKTGTSAYDSAERGVIHVAFMVSCFLFGAVQIYAATGFFQGKNKLEKAPLLYLLGVLWGVAYLILVYVFYAKSSSFVENFFAVAGGASNLLCLFYLCKLFAGVEAESAAKRVFVTGIFAVVLTVTYTFSNLALLLLGKSYFGEIPSMIQLSSLGVALFLLVFLVTFRKYNIRRTPKGGTGEFARLRTGEIPAVQQKAPQPQKPASEGKPRSGRRFRPN